MLVLSRKEGEQLVIGDNIVVTINRISGNRVAIGVEAPREVSIVRGELPKQEPVTRGGVSGLAGSMVQSDLSVASQVQR